MNFTKKNNIFSIVCRTTAKEIVQEKNKNQ